VRADVLVHILGRLRKLKADRDQAPILNFPAYVASIAYRTCYTHLRRLYPQRARLKNRLRYAMTYDADLTIDQDAFGIWRCGLTAWTGAMDDVDAVAAQEFRSRPAVFARNAIPDFADRQPVWSSTEELDAALDSADPRQPITQTLMHRQYLARLWTEVRALPVNQRVAILLNLRDEDGRSALPLLPLTGIATMRQIAETLDMPALELAALWKDLPLDDAGIALRLGLKRQQVINLRKSARERLGRRMARWA